MIRRIVWPLLAVLLVSLPLAATAKKAKKPKEKYLFNIVAVEHAAGVGGNDLDEQAKAMLVDLLTKRSEGFVTRVDGMPDPKTDPAGYTAALKKKGMRAFDVRIKFTAYKRSLTPVSDSTDQLLTVMFALEILGANPDGTLAFTGRGSATVEVQVGKKLPPKMDAGAHADALNGALGQALDEAAKELGAKKPAKPSKR
jgi:hypothetical protein